jgi:lysozyme
MINEAGLALLKELEGCKLTAYQDSAGIYTIGFGHTGAIFPGMVITRDEADQLCGYDLIGPEAAVSDAVQDATDNQFAALVLFTYNVGVGAFRQSTVLVRHLAGDYEGAANAFLFWNKAHINGVLTVVPGLTNRREAERALYLTA